MDKNMGKKKPYEAPAFRRVRLEVKTSVLAACSLSTSVSPLFPTCDQQVGQCFDLA